MKLVWRVDPAPIGRYRSFERRGWPIASYDTEGGKPAAFLSCEDEYVPRLVAIGNHKPITIILLHHNHPDAGKGWKRFKLKKTASTLAEAKILVKEFLESHEDWRPKNN